MNVFEAWQYRHSTDGTSRDEVIGYYVAADRDIVAEWLKAAGVYFSRIIPLVVHEVTTERIAALKEANVRLAEAERSVSEIRNYKV